MKEFTIIERKPNGARIANVSGSFGVKIKIIKGLVFLDFIDDQTGTIIYRTFFPVEHKGYRSFENFREKGQELLLVRLSEVIVSDICTYITGKYDDEEYPEEPYYTFNGCFDIALYMRYWAVCYDLISDDEDILDEYINPDKEKTRTR